MIILPPVTVTSAQQRVTLPISDPSQCSALVLENESAYQLAIQYPGGQKVIPAWCADVILSDGTMSSFVIVPTLNLPANTQPNNVLTIQLYGAGESLPSATQYPMELTRNTQASSGEKVLDSFVVTPGPQGNVTRTVSLDAGMLAIAIGGIDDFDISVSNVIVYDAANHDVVWGNLVSGSGEVFYVAVSSLLSGSIDVEFDSLSNSDVVNHTITIMGMSDVRVVSIPSSDIVNVQFPVLPTVVVGNTASNPVPVSESISGLTSSHGGGTGIAIGGRTALLNPVAGKTFTVYGVQAALSTTSVGFAGALVEGSVSGQSLLQLGMRLLTAVGQSGLSDGIWIPGGIVLQLGEGVSALNIGGGSCDCVGVVYYTVA